MTKIDHEKEVLLVETKALVQYFELLDENGYYGLPECMLNKFWEISILGTEVTERSGKIGTLGKTNKLKVFKSEELAKQYVEKMIVEKWCRKNYTDKSSQLPESVNKYAKNINFPIEIKHLAHM